MLAAVRNPAAADELRALAAGREARLSIFPVDLSDLPSIDALGAAVGNTPIDLLLGNAAKTDNPRCGVGDTDYGAWLEAFTVNTMAQMKLAETLVDNVAASEQKKMYFVSSRIGAEPLPGLILFRTTKSALNQVVMQLSLLLRERGIIVACGHPGFVKARSTAGMGVFEAVESAGYLKNIIDGLTPEGVRPVLRARRVDATHCDPANEPQCLRRQAARGLGGPARGLGSATKAERTAKGGHWIR